MASTAAYAGTAAARPAPSDNHPSAARPPVAVILFTQPMPGGGRRFETPANARFMTRICRGTAHGRHSAAAHRARIRSA